MKYLNSTLFLLYAFDVTAKVFVVDGDSLELNGRRIRLMGIDAPEYYQTCFDENKTKYACGKESRTFLNSLVHNARKVDCRQKDTDIYNRALSVCFADGQNLNATMVQNGYAIIYRSDLYKKEQKVAQKAKKGVWRGRFIRPEFWRILHRNDKGIKKN